MQAMTTTSNSIGPQEVRRVHDRASLAVEVTLAGDHNFFVGFSENVSEGGLFVATHSVREAGSRIALEFTLPGRDEPLHVFGVVRWVRVYNPDSDTPPGLGIQFVDLDDVVAAEIRAFVTQRAPIFFD